MRYWLTLFSVLSIAFYTNAQAPKGYNLVWADEFEGTQLNNTVWDIDTMPRRDAINSKEAVTVENGNLVLKTFVRNGKIYTGFIYSFHKLDFKYGYFECRVKLQQQLGHWSAFWLMPYNLCNADTAPNICGTEIDVYEYFTKRGTRFQHALHWNGYKGNKAKVRNMKNILEGYHTFAVLWTADSYTFYVDGKKSWKTKQSVSQVAEPLLITMEVGNWAGKVNPEVFPDAAFFDYVRVYQARKIDEAKP